MFKRFAVFLILAVFFCGCAMSMQQLKQVQMASFSAPYGKVFTAVLKTLPDYGYNVSNTDKESGLINTNWIPYTGSRASLFNYGKPQQVTVYLTKVDDLNTDIRLVIQQQDTDSFGMKSVTNSQDKEYYSQILNSIQENIK